MATERFSFAESARKLDGLQKARQQQQTAGYKMFSKAVQQTVYQQSSASVSKARRMLKEIKAKRAANENATSSDDLPIPVPMPTSVVKTEADDDLESYMKLLCPDDLESYMKLLCPDEM